MSRSIQVLVATGVAALALCASAPAATVTVGADLTVPSTDLIFNCGIDGGCTYAQNTQEAVSPVSGVIVRWRVRNSSGPLALRVLRGNTGIATSSSQTPSKVGIQEFSTNLPVSAGDRIGVDLPGGFVTEMGVSEPAAGGIDTFGPALANGSTATPLITYDGTRLLLNADVVPAPKITAVSPASGSFRGGTSVVITGTDLTGASAVTFGGIAVVFTVNSDSQITAIAPATPTPLDLSVAVTTLAGTATSPAAYKTTACVVPKLKGKTLKADRKALRRAGCRLGKVRGEKTKGAKVKRQSTRVGTLLPPGAKIGVKLAG